MPIRKYITVREVLTPKKLQVVSGMGVERKHRAGLSCSHDSSVSIKGLEEMEQAKAQKTVCTGTNMSQNKLIQVCSHAGWKQ